MFVMKIQKNVDSRVLVKIAWSSSNVHIETTMSFIKTPQNQFNCTPDAIGMANN